MPDPISLNQHGALAQIESSSPEIVAQLNILPPISDCEIRKAPGQFASKRKCFAKGTATVVNESLCHTP